METRKNKIFLFRVGTPDAYDVEFVNIEAPDEKTAQFIANRIYGKYKAYCLGIPRTLSCA